ncbi:hypothetical protein, partial [Ornithobacterium rhinotracheale]|uniref:hypothetical protein n=1 Tax=Ornithobacterium rhinotracheale TaxID=28251 RepID=UPI004036DC74
YLIGNQCNLLFFRLMGNLFYNALRVSKDLDYEEIDIDDYCIKYIPELNNKLINLAEELWDILNIDSNLKKPL